MLEVLGTIVETVKVAGKEIVEATKEVAENVFPDFFDEKISKEGSPEGISIKAKSSDTGGFPVFFDRINRFGNEQTDERIDPLRQDGSDPKVEIDSHTYETDDNGDIYKIDGKLRPGSEYVANGITYQTDPEGRIISWAGEPGYDPGAERDEEAQTDAGGEDRRPGDDGGHLVARILDGPPGSENIVAMRDTINRGDYKKAENEIANAKQEGKEVQDSGKLSYDGDSSRPSKIERTYVIDDVRKSLTVDNEVGSQSLLKDIKEDISPDDHQNLEDRINDMQENGSEVSVTSTLKEYSSDGDMVSVTVGIRDETIGTKTYVKFSAKEI